VPETEPAGSDLLGQPGRLGLGLVVVCSVAIAVGVWAVIPARQWTVAWLVALAGIAAAAVLKTLPEAGASTTGRLSFPLLVLAQLTVLGLINPLASQPYLPLILLAFIYLGLTCPPNQSWWLLPPAVAAWLVAYDVLDAGFAAALLIRLPIAMVVWILVAELLAVTAGRVRRHTTLLSEQAHTDALTGLPNRRILPQLLGDAQAGDVLGGVDVDHFGQINERLGHAGGDEVLRLLGSLLRAELREPDTAVRYGGEEILLLLPGICTPERAETALRRLSAAWATVSEKAAHEPRVTFSAGVAIVGDLESPGEAVRAADVQLYDAKQAGRNCWRIRPTGRGPAPARSGAVVSARKAPILPAPTFPAPTVTG
jgi:diguanylate cyclase (GGDEF)-like protein